jgi:dienelactone hydrolase
MRLNRCLVATAFAVLPVSLIAAGPQSAYFESAGRQIAYDIYGPQSTGPVIIMLHGAGGPDAALYRHMAEDLAAQNKYSVLFLHYFDATDTFRASPENYAAWERTVADLVEECGKNSQWSRRKVAILGFSLGASVALAAGSQMLPVSAVAEWYGSLPDEFFYQLKGMPPLLILHGQHDDNIPVSNAQQLIQLCKMKNFRCESHIYANQAHGFMPPDYDDAVKRTVDFFSRYVK